MSDDSAGLIQQLLGEIEAARRETAVYKGSWESAKRLLRATEERYKASYAAAYKQGYDAAAVEIDALRSINEKLTDELENLKNERSNQP